ncbi:hypothetical protein YTPLAS73_13010 [Nitrosarchaeum sp.]|nr:hypothetical protein YTPLAS73_13010 [Nitrosarchaeum sp.]
METPCSNQFIETDLGKRALNKQNKNKSIVVPRIALSNCGLDDADEMQVSLVQSPNGDRFIKLSPTKEKQIPNEVDTDE